ncbi:PhoD-like phosphatase N-terminal domain-containing protein [Rivibacter subsaxonicus]|uniref:PhoD-like phosphatase n=1 Tax=Rivibacter subsaxonicus TaxID=457575 RepID=A0A4Q7V9R4_9BURK|nr:PhoD-like phosphatase N-terminal domain-containing protein [Rivibacter subsaxonicus]RZT91432.1 PhoD-like phosphatase [Rivibacter subsaxonicus]
MNQDLDHPPRLLLRDAAARVVAIGRLHLGGRDRSDGTPVAVFAHGVSHAEPRADRLRLHSRVTTGVGRLDVLWEVAGDPGFAAVAARGIQATGVAQEFRLEVDVAGLRPGTPYWYRFAVGQQRSPVGQARTLPSAIEARPTAPSSSGPGLIRPAMLLA